MKRKLKKILKPIFYKLKIIKPPKFKVKITKSENEDFIQSSYKGTSIEQMEEVVMISHPYSNIGNLTYGKHVSIRKTITLDMVADITIGNFVVFSDNVSILTHDHNVKTKEIILVEDEKKGVSYSPITIGNDVYFGLNAVITKNVTNIPDGVIIGAQSILTKNPGPYEIWAGNPAKKIGERK